MLDVLTISIKKHCNDHISSQPDSDYFNDNLLYLLSFSLHRLMLKFKNGSKEIMVPDSDYFSDHLLHLLAFSFQ